MKKNIKESRLKKRRKEKQNFFNQFKKNKENYVVGNFKEDFYYSINLLFNDLLIYFSDEDYKEKFISNKWNKWHERIYEFLRNYLLDRIAKKYYHLNNFFINEQLIKRRYLEYINSNINVELDEEFDIPEKIEVKEEDITPETIKNFWHNYFKSILVVIGLKKDLEKEIVLENIQKRWF